ncbi:MAG: transglycosylase domain-containing protein [Holosporales bacterium]|jgi:penicillin-binding protein 1A|nr:transglycosylase domain-containing protein [Holosporales bacterium]
MQKRPNPKDKQRKHKKSICRIFFKYCLCIGFCGFVVLFSVLLYFSSKLPDLKNLKTEIRTPAVTIQTYDGKIIGSYGDLYEEVIQVRDLPRHVPQAFMAVEDKRFFHHFGIDVIGFLRAVYQNYIAHRVVQGGSTITQQLAKNILIVEGVVTHYDRSISRKIKELLLAFWLEYKFTKSDILMMYLNRVYFGAGTYGIDAASRKYFNKSSKKLTIFETAILAGLLKAPAKYNPTNHPNYAHERALVVLKAMEDQGFIKDAKKIEEMQANDAFVADTKPSKSCMYFCDFAYEQAKKILGDIEDDIIVVTTFDEKKQLAAQEAVEHYIREEGGNYKFSQAALVCLSRDGAVHAMLGGNGYSVTQFNRAIQANRMPGSAFKIFIYAAALEHGYQLGDMIADTPVRINGWSPGNYKWRSRGAISVLDGFTFSVNAVSVRLAQSVGLKKISRFAKKLGIYDVSVNDLSVALGTTPVTLKDLTAAYTTFMDGKPIWVYCITEIRTKSGRILYQKTKDLTSGIIDSEVLDLSRKMLRSVISSGTGRATNINEHIYGKTGTNGDSDAWFIGFYDPPKAKGFSVGVWVGNDIEKDKMASNSTGGRIPARITKMFIEKVLSSEVEDERVTDEKGQQKSLGAMLAAKL